jgi:hypothetical protein
MELADGPIHAAIPDPFSTCLQRFDDRRVFTMNRERVKIVLVALLVFLVAIQIFQPARTNPPASPSKSLNAHLKVPEGVYTSLMRACGDCHSNQSTWPWYGHVAPISWVITDDVNEGRRHMNFDDWEAVENPNQPDHRIAGICEEIKKNGMPPVSYRILHKRLSLKTQEIDSICSWSNSSAPIQTASGSQP